MTARPRLLLVEDTPSILRLYHEVLRKLDVDLIDAETGARALAALDETIPDVVLLDVELPDANGIDILRQIRARNLPSRGHRRHRARLGKGGGRGDARRRLRLHHQAVPARPPDRNRAQRARTPAIANPRGRRRCRQGGQILRAYRRLVADARGLPCDRERRVEPRHRVRHRRKRHRQGAVRPGDPPALAPPRRPVCRGQLRRHPARADGKRDVRPRQRRVHRRGRQPRRRHHPRHTAARCFSTRSARWI